MILSTSQLQALKADIAADVILNAIPHSADGYQAIADAYNLPATGTFLVYRTNVPVQDIYDQIVWANLTPTDAPTTGAGDTAVSLDQWHNRSLACQGKQFNVQIILQGQTVINAAKANVRAGLQDALTNVPSGVGGAVVSAGWNGVRDNALPRQATRLEKLFASTANGHNGTTGTLAATMVLEGAVSNTAIETAVNS